MNADIYQFKIGDFDCFAINDGTHEYRIETFFANVDRQEIEKALQSLNFPADRIVSPYTSLYVDTGENHILVDAGAGHFSSTVGRLLANLDEAGVEPTAIDVIIITHAHPDHIGGLIQADGSPTYPNATIYTMEAEWDFWLGENALEKAPDFKDSIRLAHQVFESLSSRFRYIHPECELAPGVCILEAYGHTPGHIAVEFFSLNDSVIYISDSIFHPLHIEHPDWLPEEMYIFDIDQYRETARRVLTKAVIKNSLVLGMHFPPFPSLGRVYETSQGLFWWDPLLDS